MSDQGPLRYSIVFDKRDAALDTAWPSEAEAIMEADAEIRELAEASEALQSPDKRVYTLS